MQVGPTREFPAHQTMSEYIVTARKWRPMRFEDVVGQSHVTTTLKNALATNRIAHAYLFSGPRGVGKTTTARLLAKAVNCLSPDDPTRECEVCKEITEGRSFDVLEIDGASNRGVDEIRNLREAVRYAPAKAKYKVYIIDEVHMLTKEAFNALLKTLEEPPSHVLFIFATTEIQKVPATILSRCQRFDFRRISLGEIHNNLAAIARAEGVQIDGDALLLIAKKGDGSLRDAQSIFDQVVSLCGPQITMEKILEALNIVDQEIFFRVTDLVKAKDARGGIAIINEVIMRGYDIKEFLAGVSEHLRNILIVKTTGSAELVETSDVFKQRYAEEARAFEVADLLRMLRLVNGTEMAIRWSVQPRFRLEADFVQLITMNSAGDVRELIQHVDELKKKFDDGQTAPPSSGPTGGPETLVLPEGSVTRQSAMRVPLLGRTNPVRASAPAVRSRTVARVEHQSPIPSEEEIFARWPEVIAEVRNRQRISLASVLESSTLLAAANGIVRISCSNEFQASSVTRNKELLSEIIHAVFNTRARIEVETKHEQAAPATSSSLEGTNSSLQDEHPVVQALIRELGAEPIE